MIRNLDTLEKRFDGIAGLDIQRAVAAGIKTVQAEAKARCPTDHGELKNSIFTDVEQDDDKTIGTCYTSKKYAVFVEMGTGPKGQQNHSGISPDANPVYGSRHLRQCLPDSICGLRQYSRTLMVVQLHSTASPNKVLQALQGRTRSHSQSHPPTARCSKTIQAQRRLPHMCGKDR